MDSCQNREPEAIKEEFSFSSPFNINERSRIKTLSNNQILFFRFMIFAF